jgi:undecaprenyl phosphate N,N'-diacetylbacillosamine 1-phosphate transferase
LRNLVMNPNPVSMTPLYNPYLKRLFDVVLSLTLLVLLFPLFMTVSFILSLTGRNPYFMQRRPGRYGRPFVIMKFRTMNNRCDARGYLLPDAERLTPLGRFLRSTSLDEMPQLLNVLRGEMSIVGPRPLLEEYLELYNDNQKRRHDLRPGITGWAQVNGRNELDWNQRFAYDLWYVDRCSFLLDCRIMLMTLPKVGQAEGIHSETSMTMEKYSGTL